MIFSSTVKARRVALSRQFDVKREFEEIEESCVPSYTHRNVLAAWTAWSRLNAAAKLYARHAPDGPILDFGSATGELRQVLGAPRGPYHFVEQNEVLIAALKRNIPDAVQEQGDALGEGRFAAIFALDSLEHNDNIDPILADMAKALRPEGVLILSGPTENGLYRLGRKLAGFDGHYHVQTIYDIERQTDAHFTRLSRSMQPAGIPLFSLTAWKAR